jgi:hypothetical protein
MDVKKEFGEDCGRLMILPEGRFVENVELESVSMSDENNWYVLLLSEKQLQIGDYVMRGENLYKVTELKS